MNIKIPVYRPSLSGNEKKYVNDCLDSTWISSKGEYLARFEQAYASYTGVKNATAVCNGTVALHLALLALGIGPGDEVIVPTLTYVAAVNAIVYVGATPVFVDSCRDSWQMDPNDVKAHLGPKVKVIIAVHLYGQACDMTKLREIADENNLFLVEDCAEAIGSRFGKKHVGTFGDIATFSFFGNKTITTGEGGMVVTNDDTLHDRAVHYKGQGLAKHRQYWHDVVGYNYRMTNICAAIGLAQLEQIDRFIAAKRKIAGWYMKYLTNSSVEFHREVRGTFHSYWMVSILASTAKARDAVREALSSRGIETRPVFFPVHTMPMYSGRFRRMPVAEDLGWRGVNLPSFPGLTLDNVREICSIINETSASA